MEKPNISVVIANLNRKNDLKETLLELRKQSYKNFEIIVVDNASTDGAPLMIESEFKEVRLIKLSRNLGIEGYNIGFKNAKGEIILILDNDSFPEEDAFRKILEKFEKNQKLGALGCKVINYYTKEVHHWHPYIKDEESPSGFDSPLFNGCGAAVRKDVFEKVGYYPEGFFLYENERDLCTRIINEGFEVKYYTDIIVFHKVSLTQRKSKDLIYFSTRNIIWYLWKYFPFWVSLKETTKIFYYNFCVGVKTKTLLLRLRAIFAAFLGFEIVLRKRFLVKREYINKVLY